jgi:hypothetical protein
MGKIRASLADVSTEFQLIEPGVYEFEVTAVEEAERNGEFAAYIVKSAVTDAGEQQGRRMRDYISIIKKDGEMNEVGLSQLRRYFEATHGKDEVAGWSDDDFDTDNLVGRTFRGHVKIGQYTPAGETEPRQTNEFKRIEEV